MSQYISIHALLTESDPSSTVIVILRKRFLSTLSLRRATMREPTALRTPHHFYPRSPYGERHRRPIFFGQAGEISIHALLTESDIRAGGRSVSPQLFLSTLSLRRATECYIHAPEESDISIHALLTESDSRIQTFLVVPGLFLSTLSLRRATSLWPAY